MLWEEVASCSGKSMFIMIRQYFIVKSERRSEIERWSEVQHMKWSKVTGEVKYRTFKEAEWQIKWSKETKENVRIWRKNNRVTYFIVRENL